MAKKNMIQRMIKKLVKRLKKLSFLKKVSFCVEVFFVLPLIAMGIIWICLLLTIACIIASPALIIIALLYLMCIKNSNDD